MPSIFSILEFLWIYSWYFHYSLRSILTIHVYEYLCINSTFQNLEVCFKSHLQSSFRSLIRDERWFIVIFTSQISFTFVKENCDQENLWYHSICTCIHENNLYVCIYSYIFYIYVYIVHMYVCTSTHLSTYPYIHPLIYLATFLHTMIK